MTAVLKLISLYILITLHLALKAKFDIKIENKKEGKQDRWKVKGKNK